MAKQITEKEIKSELKLWGFVWANSKGEDKQRALREGKKLREVLDVYQALTGEKK